MIVFKENIEVNPYMLAQNLNDLGIEHLNIFSIYNNNMPNVNNYYIVDNLSRVTYFDVQVKNIYYVSK
jgi:hypothetical protein